MFAAFAIIDLNLVKTSISEMFLSVERSPEQL